LAASRTNPACRTRPDARRAGSGRPALRLSRFFGMSDGFWMNLQAHYDLEVEKDRLGATLAGIEPLAAPS
jgi:plasmid maintenance system antidote protein VapI